jgi:glucose/arabinose dehydrogenase
MRNRRRSRLASVFPALLTLALLASACGRPAQSPSATRPSSPGPTTASTAPAPPGSPSPAVAPSPEFRLELVAEGLSQPVYVATPPGDTRRLFIVEKGGTIRILEDGALLPVPFLDLTDQVSTATEQGLLSLAFSPAYAVDRRFYVYYTDLAGDTAVVRYSARQSEPDRADPATRAVILTVDQPYANHNGGQLQFGPDGRLYVGLGDGGGAGDPRDYGQDPRVRLAKILRIDVGVSPTRAATYAYGLRNPWRFSFDPANGDLWIGDVGQDRWEEIDYLRAGAPPGANFGWSYFEGDHVFRRQPIDRTRLESPVFEYPHTRGCSVTGGYVYRGRAIPALAGHYVFGDFCSGRVWIMNGPEGSVVEAPVSRKVTQISSFGCDASGELYLVALSGGVYKLVP